MKIKFIQNVIDMLRHKVPTMSILVGKKYGYMSQDKSRIKTLILGSSHLYNGYLAQDGEYNFAAPSQDLYYNYQLYKQYNTPFIDTVIISFSVFTTGHVLIKTHQSNFCVLYKLIFGIDYQDKEVAKEKNLHNYEKRYSKDVSAYIQKNSSKWNGYLGNTIDYPKPINDIEKIKSIALRQYKHNQRNNNQIDFCKNILEDTLINKQKVYFVITPMMESYRNVLPAKDELFEKIYQLSKEYKHSQICNYYDDDRFDISDFADFQHLNYNGAKKLTSFIQDEIYRRRSYAD